MARTKKEDAVVEDVVEATAVEGTVEVTPADVAEAVSEVVDAGKDAETKVEETVTNVVDDVKSVETEVVAIVDDFKPVVAGVKDGSPSEISKDIQAVTPEVVESVGKIETDTEKAVSDAETIVADVEPVVAPVENLITTVVEFIGTERQKLEDKYSAMILNEPHYADKFRAELRSLLGK